MIKPLLAKALPFLSKPISHLATLAVAFLMMQGAGWWGDFKSNREAKAHIAATVESCEALYENMVKTDEQINQGIKNPESITDACLNGGLCLKPPK